MKTQRTADIFVGCLVALFGVFIMYASTLITGGAAHQLPPETFPMVVGVLLLICGSALALKSWRLRGEDFAIQWPDGEGVRTIVVMLSAVAGFNLLLNRIGLPLATFLYITFSIWYLKRSEWRIAIVISLISAAISYFLFIRLLGLSFPAGFFLE